MLRHNWHRSAQELHELFVPPILRRKERMQRVLQRSVSVFQSPLVDISPPHRHTLHGGTQTAEPQRVAASATIAAAAGTVDDATQSSASATTVRKYLGSRSPSGQSPVTKSRKTPAAGGVASSSTANAQQQQQQAAAAAAAAASTSFLASSSSQRDALPGGSKDYHPNQQPPNQHNAAASSTPQSSAAAASHDKDIGSPKSRTWKGLVARQFRRIQGAPSSPAATSLYSDGGILPEGASIGVPLAHCPMVSELGDEEYRLINLIKSLLNPPRQHKQP